MTDRSRVSLVRCADYRPEVVGEAVEGLLASIEPLPLPRGGRILLKPNCLSSHHSPQDEVNTRVEVIEAVARYVIDHHQARVVITDSAGMGSYGRSVKAFEAMGLPQAASRLGAELVEIDGNRIGLARFTSPTGLILPQFTATDLLNRVDAVINLPKLKTHMLTGLTGAIKNCLGLLPGGLKRAVHVEAPTGPLLARAMVDIYAAFKPVLNIMDGVWAMEGAGPSQGKPRRVGWLAASTDAVALDTVAAVTIGLKPERTEIISAAARAGLGHMDRESIELIGADWDGLPVPGFRRAFSGLQSWLTWIMPRTASGKVIDFFTEARPRPDHDACEQCGQCVKACPMEALSFQAGRLALDSDCCIECYCCLEHCPTDGLWAPRNLRQKLLGRPRPKAGTA